MHGGSHEPAPLSGDFSAFLKTNGSYQDFQLLIRSLHSLGFTFSVLGTENGVLVVGIDHGNSQERTEVLHTLNESGVVNHVEKGGCDVRVAECDRWTSSAVFAPSGSS
jgi:hypothetical protein